MIKRGLLLSGGMDSTALAYWLRPEYAFTVNYGQRSAKAEIAAAQQISKHLNIEHHVLLADCSSVGSGDLSNNEPLAIAPKSDWWPFRNQLLVTLCGMVAVRYGLSELIVGSVSSDQTHKDGVEEFYSALNQLMILQEGKLKVTAPAISMTTTQLIKKSGIPPELLLWSHSCHKNDTPCHNCRGCNKYFSILEGLSEYCD